MITGCSSGFGLETARHFLDQGWSVVASMRTPDETLLPQSDRLASAAAGRDRPGQHRPRRCRRPDRSTRSSTMPASAGCRPSRARRRRRSGRFFETNTFGTFEMIRAVLPQMRARRAGVNRQCFLERNAETAAALAGLHCQQGRRERLHRMSGARARAVRYPDAAGASGPGPVNPLQHQRQGADGGCAHKKRPRTMPPSRKR